MYVLMQLCVCVYVGVCGCVCVYVGVCGCVKCSVHPGFVWLGVSEYTVEPR